MQWLVRVTEYTAQNQQHQKCKYLCSYDLAFGAQTPPSMEELNFSLHPN